MKIFIEPLLINWKKLLSKACEEITDNIENADIVITCYSNFENFKNKPTMILLLSKNDIEKYKNQKDNHYGIESIKFIDNVEFLKIGDIEIQPNNTGIYYKKNVEFLLGVIKGNKLFSNIMFSEIHKSYYSKSIIEITKLFVKEFEKRQITLFPKFSDKEWKAIERVINYNIEFGSGFQNFKDFLRIAEADIKSEWLNFFIKEKIFELDKNNENIRFTENALEILKNLAENLPELNKILGD